MSEKHTPGLWAVFPVPDPDKHQTPIVQKGGVEPVLFVGIKGRPNRANAHRIAAAINACEGVPTEALQPGIVKELLEEAMKHCVECGGPADERVEAGMKCGECAYKDEVPR